MLRRSVTTDEAIREAAQIIRQGGLAAFPTETVYGLGADAFNPHAVARIYQAKGRPSDNPLILHVCDGEALAELAAAVPEYARKLIGAFWPGPLTLVVNKHPRLPAWVGGHPEGSACTVAVRAPSHPVARALIAYAECPIAAPSANKAGRPSPTSAWHVVEDFDENEIDLLLDGGEVSGGLESTVIDVTGQNPVLLRPGAVTAEMVYTVTGLQPEAVGNDSSAPRSPGMKYRHYAPRAPMTIVSGEPDEAAARIAEAVSRQPGPVGILATAQTAAFYRTRFGEQLSFDPQGGTALTEDRRIAVLIMGDRNDPQTVAHGLYACLRRFDALGVQAIYAESVAEDGLGQAIMNRMMKAAGGNRI